MAKNDDVLRALAARFGEGGIPDEVSADLTPLTAMIRRGSCRWFQEEEIPRPVIDALCATALAAPTKSDLQQRDIIVIEDAQQKAALLSVVADQDWTAEIPHLLIFCGNNRRQRLIQDWHELDFANDHLDAFLNAAADAAIAMTGFVYAAEALGFGCCPISAIRNRPGEVARLLGLPDHVFPFAGLGLGIPMFEARESQRLPLNVTVHTDHYAEADLRRQVNGYDTRRRTAQPFRNQRRADELGARDDYGWSLDKARQYSLPERADFGDYIRKIGFKP